jgi:hypothetical protein
MSVLIAKIIVPPYCGVPRLSHQFPVTAVVVAVVVVGVVVLGVVVVVLLVVVVVCVGVEVDEVVLLHDAKTSDATTRQVTNIQVIPFFIQTSIYFRILPENLPWSHFAIGLIYEESLACVSTCPSADLYPILFISATSNPVRSRVNT